MTNPKILYQAILDKHDKDYFYFSYVKERNGGVVKRKLTISTDDFTIIPEVAHDNSHVALLADSNFKNVELVDVYTLQARGHYAK